MAVRFVEASRLARARLRRHPPAIAAHFRQCITLTYALPPEVLRPLLSL